jgi:hypothetical protein
MAGQAPEAEVSDQFVLEQNGDHYYIRNTETNKRVRITQHRRHGKKRKWADTGNDKSWVYRAVAEKALARLNRGERPVTIAI